MLQMLLKIYCKLFCRQKANVTCENKLGFVAGHNLFYCRRFSNNS